MRHPERRPSAARLAAEMAFYSPTQPEPSMNDQNPENRVETDFHAEFDAESLEYARKLARLPEHQKRRILAALSLPDDERAAALDAMVAEVQR